MAAPWARHAHGPATAGDRDDGGVEIGYILDEPGEHVAWLNELPMYPASRRHRFKLDEAMERAVNWRNRRSRATMGGVAALYEWALRVYGHWEFGVAGTLEHGVFLRRYVNTLVAIVFNLTDVVNGLMGDADIIIAPQVHERFVGRNAHDYALLLRMQATCQEWDTLLLESQGFC